MSFSADVTACAQLVEKADPDRFRAVMASPLPARQTLFPLYAFNVEAARAPWVTQEPMIAEMRLQWWRDALEEIATGQTPRRHEVVTPLSDVLDAKAASLLDAGLAARRWDIYKDPFEDAGHFEKYLASTAGHLMWVAARCLGADDKHQVAVTELGSATGLARFLQAIPELEARGRIPLVEGTPQAISELASRARSQIIAARKSLRQLPNSARPALTEAYLALPLLTRAAEHPSMVAQGRLVLSPIQKSFQLWRWS